MADLISSIGQNYKKHVISQSGVGREFILSITAGSGTLQMQKWKHV